VTTKKILFITSTRLGDAILSTGALAHFAALHPHADITVACGAGVAEIFTAAPKVTRVIPLQKKPFSGHWIYLWKKTAATAWDIVVDLRNGPVSRLIRARKKYIWNSKGEGHKVEQIAALVGASPPPGPTLWVDEKTALAAEKLIPAGNPVLGIGPAANWPAKTWASENFIELIARLTSPGGVLPGARVAVFAAPNESGIAGRVLQGVPEEQRIDCIGKTTPLLAAGAIARCVFYVGNDSGLMHAAAAMGVPTLGLFGPSYPALYRPWGERCAYASTPETFDELTSYKGYDPKTAPCLMTTLTVDAVQAAAEKLLRS